MRNASDLSCCKDCLTAHGSLLWHAAKLTLNSRNALPAYPNRAMEAPMALLDDPDDMALLASSSSVSSAAKKDRRRYVNNHMTRRATRDDYKLCNISRPGDTPFGPAVLDSWLHRGLFAKPDSRATIKTFKNKLSKSAMRHANRVRTPELALPINQAYTLREQEKKKDRLAVVRCCHALFTQHRLVLGLL